MSQAVAEIAKLRRELRDARMVLAAIVLKHGDLISGDRVRLEITDQDLFDAPGAVTTYRQLDPGMLVLEVRRDVGHE